MRNAPNKKVVIVITIVVGLIIAFSGVIFFQGLKKKIRQEKEIDLTVIAQIKINQLYHWVKDQSSDISVLAQSSYFVQNIENWLSNRNDPSLHNQILEQLEIPQKEYHYKTTFLLSTKNELLFSTDSVTYFQAPQLLQTINDAVEKGGIVHSDFYLSEPDQMVYYDIIAPILSSKRKHIATLVFRVNPEEYLYPLIQSWPTPSTTSETLIIRKENDHVLFLNELRHQAQSALKLSITLEEKTLPAVMVAEGAKGIVTGIDYRDKKVVAYVSPVPGTNWFMVSKVDQDELFKELVSQGFFILFTTILIILIVGASIALFYTFKEKNTYRSLWQTQEEYKTTLYSIGDAVIITDQYGYVKQINKIAEGLTGWNEYEATDLPLSSIFKIFNENTRFPVDDPVKKVLRRGSIVNLANHTLLVSKDGREIPIADSAAPIRNSEGEIIGVVLVFRDQSEEKQHINAIKASRDFAENIIGTLHEGLVVLDERMNIVLANQTFTKAFGYDQKEILGNDFLLIGNAAWDNQELKVLLKQIIPQNTRFDDFEMKYLLEDGETRTLNLNASCINSINQRNKNILLVINDITEKQRLIEELTISKQKAEESNNLKTAFLANMSHEIRTPLNGILGFSSMIIDEDHPKEHKSNYLKIIENSGQRLLNIVNDILDISLIQSNQLKIKFSEFPIKEFMEELLTIYQTLKKEKLQSIDLRLEFITDKQNLLINTDKDRLFQVFKNLLDNSFKFTEKGHISFGVAGSDEYITCYVEDTGKGIPANQVDVIFEKFQQIESSKGKHIEGTGLGLAIAKGLVERMGGKIWVESQLGVGTKFFFKLPLS